MKTNQSSTRGFSLIELTVASAAVGMLLLLAGPALNKGRAGVDVRRCQDNLRRLARAQLMYAGANGGFPPMSLALPGVRDKLPGPGSWYDDHSWYSYIATYVGEPAWAATLNFTRSVSDASNQQFRRGGLRIKLHACPADIGLQRHEWFSSTWANVRSNYVVNAGNTNYGQMSIGPVPFFGAPFAGGRNTPLASISDGLSHTLLMSETFVLPETQLWAGAYSYTQLSLGGQVFTGFNGPNSSSRDQIGRGLFGNQPVAQAQALYLGAGFTPENWPEASGDNSPLSTRISARSKHPGGVNAVMCNGAVGFVANAIDPAVWRALSTAQGFGSGAPEEINPIVN